MKQFFETVKRQLEQKKDLVLVSVIASSGSTPRGAGARMVVTEAGRIYGTIGGGAVEYRSTQMALDALKSRSSIIHEFCLARNEVEDLGMICGGDVTVYFRYISHTDAGFIDLVEHILKLFESGETSWLLTECSEENQSGMGIYGVKSGLYGIEAPDFDMRRLIRRAQHIKIGEKGYYVEEIVNAGKVYVFGGGHVSQELIPALARVGFRCAVADDRPEFASKELFPDAENVYLVDFENIGRDITLTENDAVCVMTRGHANDTVVALQALKTPACYVGVIGSAKKIAAMSQLLRENGISEEKIAGLHSPIGISIKAETPAEIAVSITAELILERAKRL